MLQSNGVDIQKVNIGEQISYQCTGCGNCCRHIKDSLMLETPDAFRIAQYFQQKGNFEIGIDEILNRYTKPVSLDDWGYPIFLINTTGADDTCVFLKDNRCTIQSAKPRTCRLYPFTADPGERGSDFTYYICMDNHSRHFSNGKISVTNWLRDNFSSEERRYVQEEYASASKLGKLLRKLPQQSHEAALFHVLYYKYFNFDLNNPFLPQYKENNKQLTIALQKLVRNY